jgi:hypothetical protein
MDWINAEISLQATGFKRVLYLGHHGPTTCACTVTCTAVMFSTWSSIAQNRMLSGRWGADLRDRLCAANLSGNDRMMTSQVQFSSSSGFVINFFFYRTRPMFLCRRAYCIFETIHPRSCGPSMQVYACSPLNRGVYLPVLVSLLLGGATFTLSAVAMS